MKSRSDATKNAAPYSMKARLTAALWWGGAGIAAVLGGDHRP